MVDRLRGVPAWGWLVAIVIASFALRAWLARGMLGPFIMVDELIYSELARSIAAGDGFQVRDVPAGGFSLVYPILISPAYALFDSLPDAYAAVKTLNALYMSLAAVPAYLLARRVLAPPLSLFAAVLAVALPSLVYTGTVMTENAFYPLFLTGALLLVLVLERPTPARQVGLVALVGVLFATRVQAVAFVPAIVAAPFLLALLGRRPLRATLWSFRLLYGLLAAGARAPAAGAARARPVALRPARRLLDRRRALLRRRDGRALLPLPPGRARPLPRRPALRGLRPARAARPPAGRGGRPVPRRGDRPLHVRAARRRRVRVRVRQPDPGAERLRRRAVLPDRAARPGRPRPAAAALARAARGCRCRAAPADDPVGALHRDGRDLGHARPAADLGRLRLAAVRLDRRHRADRRRDRSGALPARPAPIRARAAGGDAPLLRGDRAQRLGRRARRQAGIGRGALLGHARRRARLDRPGPPGRRDRGVRLDRRHRPLRRQPERVLQPQRRARLLHRRSDPRWARRDGGDRRRGERGAPHGRRRPREGELPARRGPDLAGRRRRRARSRDGAEPLARVRPTRRDDDAGRGPLSGRHVVGPHRDVDPGALSGRKPHRRPHERPEPLPGGPGRDRVRERQGRRPGAGRAVRHRGAARPHGSGRRRHVPRRLPDGDDEGARSATTRARSAPTSAPSTTGREDRVRRQPALAPADGDRQLRPRLARRAGRGGGGEARARRLRADAAARPQVDPRGAGRPPGRAAHRRPAVVARLPDGLEPPRPALRRSASSAGSTCSTSATGWCRRSATGSARRWCTTSSRCSTRSG